MTRVALKGLASRPVRTLLTTLAIVLGVGMVSAAFTLTDTMRGAADSLSSAAYDGTDAVVSARTAFEVDSSTDWTIQKPTIDASLLGDGPRRAAGRHRGRRHLRPGADHRPQRQARRRRAVLRLGLRLEGPGRREADGVPPPDRPLGDRPRRGRHRRHDRRQAGLRDRRPRADLDPRRGLLVPRSSASRASAPSSRSAPRPPRCSTCAPRSSCSTSRAATTRSSSAGRSGVPATDVRKAVAAKVGTSAQVQTAAAHDRFTLDGLKQFIGIIKTVLLVFGGVAVLVGAFTIFNTLSITVAQRTREFAMLRMVGAARRQVLGSVLIEALALGLGASIIGIAAGFASPPGSTPCSARSTSRCRSRARCSRRGPRSWRCSVGTLVTLVAGFLPARRATKIAPVAALRDSRSVGPQAAPAGACGARGGLAARASGGRRRRLRRQARAPQRDAPPEPHGGHGERADDRRDARDRGHRGRQRPPSGDQGHAQRPHRRVARDHRAGRLVAGRPGRRAKAAASVPGVTAVSALRQDGGLVAGDKEIVNGIDPATVAKVFDFRVEGRLQPGPLLARRRTARSSTRAGRRSTA